jgi:hypothetical protein
MWLDTRDWWLRRSHALGLAGALFGTSVSSCCCRAAGSVDSFALSRRLVEAFPTPRDSAIETSRSTWLRAGSRL